MANIPPKKFYSLSKERQWSEAVKMYQQYQAMAEEWRKISVQCAKRHIPDPEIYRIDLLELKS